MSMTSTPGGAYPGSPSNASFVSSDSSTSTSFFIFFSSRNATGIVLPIPFSPDTEDTVKPLLDEEDVKHGAQNNFEPFPPPSKKELLIKASVVFVLVVVVDILASFITRFDAIIVIIPRRLHILSYVLFVSLRSFMTNERKKKRKNPRDKIFFCLGCTNLRRTKTSFSLFSLLWFFVFWINFRQKLARTLVTTLASIITMSGVGILTISTVRTTSFSRRCFLSSSSASARCVRANKTLSLRSFKNFSSSSSSSRREQGRRKLRKGDEDDDDVHVRNEKRNSVRTRAIFGGDAMMMPPPDAGGVVSTNNAPEIERVEMLKQRNRSNVFDIADASSLSLAAPPAVLMSETPPEIETVAPNLMEEDSLNIATAPDVVVQSSIKDAMALIQAEEREAKIASGEIVGTLFRLFSFPFVAFFFFFSLAFVFLRLLHRRSTVIWAIHSVPLSQHFYCAATSTLGPRARRLTIGYLFRWIGVRRNV
jgi:hypothetical protein